MTYVLPVPRERLDRIRSLVERGYALDAEAARDLLACYDALGEEEQFTRQALQAEQEMNRRLLDATKLVVQVWDALDAEAGVPLAEGSPEEDALLTAVDEMAAVYRQFAPEYQG